jgi:hypothetical protein
VQLARTLYEERRFEDLPVLGDALEEAGCQDAAVLEHCRGPGPHVRGCWVVDLLLGRGDAVTEEQWLEGTDPTAMLGFLGDTEKASERKLRLFGCACCRRVWHNMDKHSRRAVEVAERFADEGAGWWERLWYKATTWPGGGWWEGHPGRTATVNGPPRMAAFLLVSRWSQPQTEAVDVAFVSFTMEEEKSSAGQCHLLREILGNPFCPLTLDPAWKTPTVLLLARSLYEERRFEDMPVLADALEEAGCTDAELLGHLRSPGPHVRGCWGLDVVLGKS